MTEYDPRDDMPEWARRLPKYVGVAVFLFFVGGFGIREWLAAQPGGAGGALGYTGWLLAWGVLLLIGSAAAWRMFTPRPSRQAT